MSNIALFLMVIFINFILCISLGEWNSYKRGYVNGQEYTCNHIYTDLYKNKAEVLGFCKIKLDNNSK